MTEVNIVYRLRLGKCLLRFVLQKYGLRQRDLAERLNMPRQQVSDYVNEEKKMTLETAASIANAIGCRIEELYEFPPADRK